MTNQDLHLFLSSSVDLIAKDKSTWLCISSKSNVLLQLTLKFTKWIISWTLLSFFRDPIRRLYPYHYPGQIVELQKRISLGGLRLKIVEKLPGTTVCGSKSGVYYGLNWAILN